MAVVMSISLNEVPVTPTKPRGILLSSLMENMPEGVYINTVDCSKSIVVYTTHYGKKEARLIADGTMVYALDSIQVGYRYVPDRTRSATLTTHGWSKVVLFKDTD